MTQTRHITNCKRVFRNYDLGCPRCLELLGGAAPREGWGDRRRQEEAQHLQDIRTHDFAACMKKNVVCTCFDW